MPAEKKQQKHTERCTGLEIIRTRIGACIYRIPRGTMSFPSLLSVHADSLTAFTAIDPFVHACPCWLVGPFEVSEWDAGDPGVAL